MTVAISVSMIGFVLLVVGFVLAFAYLFLEDLKIMHSLLYVLLWVGITCIVIGWVVICFMYVVNKMQQ